MCSSDLEIVDIDSVAHSGILLLHNQSFMADVWLYSNEIGLKFCENFIHLLPGLHRISFTFDVKIGEIKLMHR